MTVDISLKHLKAGLKELKLLKAGKVKGRPIEQLLHEIENGIRSKIFACF